MSARQDRMKSLLARSKACERFALKALFQHAEAGHQDLKLHLCLWRTRSEQQWRSTKTMQRVDVDRAAVRALEAEIRHNAGVETVLLAHWEEDFLDAVATLPEVPRNEDLTQAPEEPKVTLLPSMDVRSQSDDQESDQAANVTKDAVRCALPVFVHLLQSISVHHLLIKVFKEDKLKLLHKKSKIMNKIDLVLCCPPMDNRGQKRDSKHGILPGPIGPSRHADSHYQRCMHHMCAPHVHGMRAQWLTRA